MNTLAKVGATSNSLWWALNGVILLFACSKCGTTVRESPYTDMILFQSNTTHCAKLGLMWVQESYMDTFTAQVAAPGLFGGFSFHGLKKLKVGDS
jgi:hypothetical protein